jgi:quercetin dioxygenase-like cupin family protein
MRRYLSLLPRTSAAVMVAASLSTALAEQSKPPVTEPATVIQFDRDRKSPCEGLPGCDFILLAGDPSKSATQWLFRLRGGQAFPKHWHNTPENMVAVRGSLTFNFETGQRHTLRPGEYLHYQAGMIHWGQCEPEEDCLFYVFNDQPYDIHVLQ